MKPTAFLGWNRQTCGSSVNFLTKRGKRVLCLPDFRIIFIIFLRKNHWDFQVRQVINSYSQSMQRSFWMLVVIKQAADSSSLSKLVGALSTNVVNTYIFSGTPSNSLKVGCSPLLCFSLWVQASESRLRQSVSGCKMRIREDTENFFITFCLSHLLWSTVK